MEMVINGQPRVFPSLKTDATVAELVEVLGLKGDRVAVEHNGAIVGRAQWAITRVADSDRVEIVHFVGGGCSAGGGSSAGK